MKGRKLISGTLRLALIFAVICGVVYPVVVTGIGQALFPYQANGDLAQLGNATVGSYLIGQSVNNSPYLFHVRNDSASGVDPDITVASALAQALVIHNTTNISIAYLDGLIHNNTQYSMFFFGTAFVNALSLNIQIIDHFHNSIAVYAKIYNMLNDH
ncbi:MAG: potassium-transporting ATPase subunit C [Candidatus Thermoplasmatota archaeon]|jgi:K+-transporting ATPase ATPase C chain|nr:potassium-transporting ATPase subunit C [Candidatus Thermoplasmatota archaeon]